MNLTRTLLHTLHCCLFLLDLLLVMLDAVRNLGNVGDPAVLEVVLVVLSLDLDECVDLVEFHGCFVCWRLGKMPLGCCQKSISIF